MLNKNIVLIGMPSTGKSTVGKELSNRYSLDFIDTDTLIREFENMELKDIVAEKGLEKFLEIQEKIILNIDITKCHIVSTGGGIIHCDLAMSHLKKKGFIIYLNTSKEILKERIIEGRRFAKTKNKSFDDLYEERVPLYKKYSDFEINCNGKNIDEIVCIIVNILQKNNIFK